MLKPGYLNQQISMWWFKYIFMVVFLVSCFSKPKVGGPCTYKNTTELILVDSVFVNGNYSDVRFKKINEHDSENKLFKFSQYIEHFADSSKVANLKKGDTCSLILQEIKSGSCTPRIYSIKFPN